MELLRRATAPLDGPGEPAQARRFPGEPASVPDARRHVREVLRQWQRPDLEEAGALVATELVTNAVLHAGTDVVVELVRTGDDVVLLVGDSSTRLPVARRHGREASTGRGMWLLDHFTSDRGVEVGAQGKRVWAVLCPEQNGVGEGAGARLATLLDERDRRGGASAV